MLALRIALRYLLSKKTHNAVNIISAISVAGVAVATAAIVIVLSVFNGFSQLAVRHLSMLDPQLKIVPAAGKVMADADSVAAAVTAVDGVELAMPSLSERALLMAGQRQTPVVFKGVTDSYSTVTDVDSTVIDGFFATAASDSVGMATLSAGVAVALGVRPGPDRAVDIYVPRRVGRVNPANPSAAFTGRNLLVSGVFETGQAEYDADCVIIPLDVARSMLDYTTEASAVELRLDSRADLSRVADEIGRRLGPAYKVLDRYRQQESSFKMIAVEKWVTLLMLVFILCIACFNIISTLSLLVIEKSDSTDILRAAGASKAMVRSVFVWQGRLITLIGGIAGIAIGTALALAQQHWGLVELQADPAALTVTAYPVEVHAADLVIVAAIIIVTALVTGAVTKLFTRNIR